MADHQFEDPDLAALYDDFCATTDRGDLDFYLPLVMAASSVLDVGCGTGALLHRARAEGHGGRLCGLDPAAGMLRPARRRTDVEWVLGDLSSTTWEHEFELVVMSGHAFQVFLTDDEVLAALRAIRSALETDGRFAFETRNPAARAWEQWTPQQAVEIVDATGAVVRMEHKVESVVDAQYVTFLTTYRSTAWETPRESRSTLRFLDASSLAARIADAGLVVEAQFGDWDRQPLSDGAPEIITIARTADRSNVARRLPCADTLRQ